MHLRKLKVECCKMTPGVAKAELQAKGFSSGVVFSRSISKNNTITVKTTKVLRADHATLN